MACRDCRGTGIGDYPFACTRCGGTGDRTPAGFKPPEQICRHAPGDPNCSSSPEGRARAEYERARNDREEVERLRKQVEDNKPDAANYEIQEVRRVGPHLVLKVLYPSCAKCAYEGSKVMVFLNVTEVQVLRWRHIDPHFRAPTAQYNPNVAPSPAARFPASKEGWEDAIAFAERKDGRQ